MIPHLQDKTRIYVCLIQRKISIFIYTNLLLNASDSIDIMGVSIICMVCKYSKGNIAYED